MTAQPRCVSCRFWEATGRFENGRIAGLCRRYPPIPRTMSQTLLGWLRGTERITYQETKSAPDDWCGEHQPNPEGSPT